MSSKDVIKQTLFCHTPIKLINSRGVWFETSIRIGMESDGYICIWFVIRISIGMEI